MVIQIYHPGTSELSSTAAILTKQLFLIFENRYVGTVGIAPRKTGFFCNSNNFGGHMKLQFITGSSVLALCGALAAIGADMTPNAQGALFI